MKFINLPKALSHKPSGRRWSKLGRQLLYGICRVAWRESNTS
jgi:hypothetical protein